MAAYMLGYGAASYGIGKILELSSFQLSSLYRFSIIIAIGIIVLGIILTGQKSKGMARHAPTA